MPTKNKVKNSDVAIWCTECGRLNYIDESYVYGQGIFKFGSCAHCPIGNPIFTSTKEFAKKAILRNIEHYRTALRRLEKS